MNIDAIDFIKNEHDRFKENNSNMNRKCCISSKTSFRNTFWENKNKVHEWNCGFHQAFYVSIIQKYMADVIHPINLQNLQKNQLTSDQQQKIKTYIKNNLDKCPICSCSCIKDKPNKLKPYYRLPVRSGTIIIFEPYIDQDILDSSITSNKPILIDTEGYRGIGLYVVHSNGITAVDIDEYYPIWNIYEDFITPSVIKSFFNYNNGYRINSNIFYSFHDNKFCKISLNKLNKDWDNLTLDILNEKMKTGSYTLKYSKEKYVVFSNKSCLFVLGDVSIDLFKLNKNW